MESRRVAVRCSYCQAEFWLAKSKAKSKTGYLFCSRDCKEAMQSKYGKSFEADTPYSYGGKTSYRRRAFAHHGSFCERCGYDEEPRILQVHHRDENRENNTIANLEVLCPNCHAIAHLGV